MRTLLDECLPRQLARELASHSVRTASQAGWTSFENGRLLRLAAEKFDAFITIDRRLVDEHDPPSPLKVVVLSAVDNRLGTIRNLVPAILRALDEIGPGRIARVQ